jgi:hypothetical protein
VTGRREARFPAGDVEAGHPLIAVGHGELGDLPGTRCRAHRRQQHPGGQRGAAAPLPEALQHRLDHCGQLQGVHVQFGSEPDLRVNDAVGSKILGTFAGDANERLLRLHDRDRVVEGLEIAVERARGGRHSVKPLGQLGDALGGQLCVTDLLCQLSHGLRAQATIEMVMQ